MLILERVLFTYLLLSHFPKSGIKFWDSFSFPSEQPLTDSLKSPPNCLSDASCCPFPCNFSHV